MPAIVTTQRAITPTSVHWTQSNRRAAKHTGRRYRTGRNVQLNVKVLQTTFNDFYAVTEAQGWVLGYTLQRAIEALQRELTNTV